MSTDVVAIRRANSEELAGIYTQVSQNPVPFDVDHWQRQSLVAGSFTYILELDDIFGFVSAGSADLPDASIGEIYGLWIAPTFRRQGWGRKLLVRGISVLKRRNFSQGLCYLSEDIAAAKMLQGLGFAPTSFERVSNSNAQSVRQVGYQLDLSDYF